MPALASAAAKRSVFVVASSLAAQQWEMQLTAGAIRSGIDAWETPPLLAYGSWLETLWLQRGPGLASPPLSRAQALALWRRVVAESAESGDLIGHAGAAEWAADAWQLLHRWQIDPLAQRAASSQPDYRALLGWCRDYRERLAAHGWVDRAELETRLTLRDLAAGGEVVATDLGDTYPARTALFAHLAASGVAVRESGAPAVVGRQRAVRLADGNDELRTAFAWSQRRLREAPTARIGIVVAGLGERRDEVHRLLASSFHGHEAAIGWSAGQSTLADPVVGAALTALTLLSPSASYAVFGRWLRSPFFALAQLESTARARLDRELRTDLRSQLSFRAAYRHCGLKELLLERAPQSGAALAQALAEVGALAPATPGRWAHRFSRYLTRLGWQAPGPSVLRGWQAGLDELASLTPIVGELSIEAALRELEQTLGRASPATLPLSGVHVLGRVQDVGPSYDAVWVTGFTDAHWPEAPHSNPLLPLATQRAFGMPHASPQDSEARSARALERLVLRAPELVVSWPARVYDYETEPSPSIREWPFVAAEELLEPPTTRTGRRALETVDDVAPPFTGTHLPGGTGMLGRQAVCPVQAFCRDRLGARTLEPIRFGVTPGGRGQATHDALQILLANLPTRAELDQIETPSIDQSVERALAKLFGRAKTQLQALVDLEAQQLRRVLSEFLQRERQRAPFKVRAVEQRLHIALGSWTLSVRIDRVDELADGSIAIIDYKTSKLATSAAWFGPRLRDPQVPLYAVHATNEVSAAVIARLLPAATSYSGLWRDDAFPGRQSRSADPDFTAQLTAWRLQLEQLAAEFATGDTRAFAADYEAALGDYAPLTRVIESLADLPAVAAALTRD